MNITLDTPIHKIFLKNIINISCFLREIYVLMLRNMYWCWQTWEDIWCVYLFFSGFYRYGENMGLSQLKTGSRKYGRDTPPPASRPISVFFRKYGNGRDKYRNTDGMGRDFFRPFSSLFIMHAGVGQLLVHACLGIWKRLSSIYMHH